MNTVKVIGVILLSVFLIFWGLLALAGVSVPSLAFAALGAVAIAAGVLLLISMGTFRHPH